MEPVRGFELPTARQVVGRGLQLALEASADIRRASLYVGLLAAVVAGPAAVLLMVDLPALAAVPWDAPETMTPDQALTLAGLIAPLYVAVGLAFLGIVSALLDGQLMVASLLTGRLAGVPLTMREALARARQVFWRYGLAAFAVGLVSAITSLVVSLLAGTFTSGGSIGSSLFAAFVAAILTAPFGYILLGVVAGDVGAGTALRRSVALARARPALAAVIAAFTFLSSSITVFGISVAVEVAGDVAAILKPDVGPGTPTTLAAIAVAVLALVAYGSLSVTVAALAASPQVAAFLGLTHYAAGLDRARMAAPEPVATPEPVAVPEAIPALEAVPTPEPVTTQATMWAQVATPARRPARWVTIPMAALVGLEIVVVLAGLMSGSAAP